MHCNELLHRLGYDHGLLNQEIQRVHTITHTDTQTPSQTISDSIMTHMCLSWCRIPPNPSLKFIYFSHGEGGGGRGVTLGFKWWGWSKDSHYINILSSSQVCATVFKYIPLIAFPRTNKSEVRDSWTCRSEPSINVIVLFTNSSPFFARSARTSATGGHLDRGKLELLRGQRTVWKPWRPSPCYIWNLIYKMARSDNESLSQRSYGTIGDCEQWRPYWINSI